MLAGFLVRVLRGRWLVLLLAALLLVFGIYQTSQARFDVFPEFAPAQVIIQTEAPGMSPEEVETLMTRPIEQVVNGANGLETMRSQSIAGLSLVTLIFAEGTPLFQARQLVAERLQEASRRLPQNAMPPVMLPLTTSTSTILNIGLTSSKRSLRELRSFADWTLKPALLSVPGVAKISVFGGEVKQFQVQILPERMLAHHVSLQELQQAIQQATGTRAGGFVDTPTQRVTVRTENPVISADLLGQTLLKAGPQGPLRLNQVARVSEAGEPKVGDAAINGQPGVILVISNQLGANTLETTRRLEQTLDQFKPLLARQQIQLEPHLFRAADFIETALHNMRSALLWGGLLVTLIIVAFQLNLRSAAISLIAIPLSLLSALLILKLGQLSINTMTLGGLAIALGEVVDDAIIDVENIDRRLRQNRALGSPRTPFDVVLAASLEVRGAVIYATLIVVLVFLPVLAMSGVQGQLFAPLAQAYILAILASLAVALTLTPALCLLWLPRSRAQALPRWSQALKAAYGRLLRVSLAARPLILSSASALLLACLLLLPHFKSRFLPELRESHFVVHVSLIPGSSLQESLRLGQRISQTLGKIGEVAQVSQKAGRAEKADDTWGTHYSEFDIELKPGLGGAEIGEAQQEIQDALARFPGISFSIKAFLSERIEEVVSGQTAQVVVKLFGEDLAGIEQGAQQVAQALAQMPGARDVQLELQSSAPQLLIRPDLSKLLQFGFQSGDLLDTIQLAFQGRVLNQIYQGSQMIDVVAVLAPEYRHLPEQAGRLLLTNSQGQSRTLGQLARLSFGSGRTLIRHEGGRRYQVISCNAPGQDLAGFAQALERRLQALKLPAGVYPQIGGFAQAQAQAERDLWLYSGLSGLGILLLLSLAFRRWRHVLLVLLNLPFALAGGVLMVFFTGQWLTIGSLLGFVTLFGITARNTMMLISHWEHLVQAEGKVWNTDTLILGATERLVPVLMTALVTGLGLLPIALGGEASGREIEAPMAQVIVGGLLTSTLLNLWLLPLVFQRWGVVSSETAEDFSQAREETADDNKI